MKKFKKIFAVMLSLVMALGMSLTAFAATNAGGSETINDKNTAVATVNNVEAGATVTAYRIVQPTYNSHGFVAYERAAGITETLLKDMLKPTADEVTKIASDKKLLDTLKSVPMTAAEGSTTYTADLNAGYWIVVVTGGNRQVVYNPMLVGVYYTSGSNSTLTNEAVSADSNWSLSTAGAYAKSSKPDMNKEITGSVSGTNNASNTDENLNGTSGKGNDVAIGDTVQYKITANFPAYSKAYTNVKVDITDSLSTGLTLKDAPVVTVGTGETAVTATAGTDYTYTKGTPDNGFTVAFNSAYALLHQGESIVVTYEATLNDNAVTGFNPNTNKATFEYTNDPQNVDNTETIEKETYTYTFEIDGDLTGKTENGEEWTKSTDELLKGYKFNEKTETGITGLESEYAPLAGATFTLTNDKTGKVYTAVTDNKGHMHFKGLDAGEYTLAETVAPDGYSINEETVPVVISATYDAATGKLANYEIKVNNKTTTTYTASYNADKTNVNDVVVDKGHETKIWDFVYNEDGTIKEENGKPVIVDENGNQKTLDTTSDSYFFYNTKINGLPSTGGIGTTIFTIAGCLIMVAAAGLFFASRRKASVK